MLATSNSPPFRWLGVDEGGLVNRLAKSYRDNSGNCGAILMVHSSMFTQLRIDHVGDSKYQVHLMCTYRKAHSHMAKELSHFRCPPICHGGAYTEKTIFLSFCNLVCFIFLLSIMQ